MFVYRKTLQVTVDELARYFRPGGDVPAEHTCHAVWSAGTGPGSVVLVRPACRSRHDRTTGLLGRLEELATPSMGTVHGDGGGGGKKAKGPGGSPAPWAARPAELLDEIQRGAIELNENARRLLGFGPLPAGPLAARARAALVGLPDLWVALAASPGRDEHWLAKGRDSIDERVRRWHRDAQLLTGHEVPWASVGQFPLKDPPARRQGPVCPHEGDDTCRHQSCRAIQATPRQRWETGRCPYCWSASLRQDPTTGNVICLKPSCSTVDGERHVWTVDELERLGVIILSEAGAA